MFICFEFKLVFDYIIGFWFTSQNRRAHASSTRKKSYMFMLNVVKELEELSNKNWLFGYGCDNSPTLFLSSLFSSSLSCGSVHIAPQHHKFHSQYEQIKNKKKVYPSSLQLQIKCFLSPVKS